MSSKLPTLWVVASDQECSVVICRELADLRSRTHPRFGWCTSAGMSKHDSPPVPIADLAGAVVAIDEHSLRSDALVRCVARLVVETADRTDFCIFPWLRGVETQELLKQAEDGNALARLLVEDVHLVSSMDSQATLLKTMGDHLKNIETLRAFAVFERLSHRMAQGFGKMGLMVSWIVVLVALAVAGAHLADKPIKTPLSITVFHEIEVLLLLASVSILSLRFACVVTLPLDYPWHIISTCTSGMVILLAVAALQKKGMELTMLVGVGLGLMLVSLIRKGRRADVNALSFGQLPERINSRSILPELYNDMVRSRIHSGVPFIEFPHKRVFISYSRSSPWSRNVAGEIADCLSETGAYVFLDRSSLLPGLPWKKQLGLAIVSSNVFIAVLDATGCSREWIAAEYAAAYRAKIVKGTPEIFVVHPGDTDFTKSTTPSRDFFAELLVHPAKPIPHRMLTRMAIYNRKTFVDMCRGIRSWPITGSLGMIVQGIVAVAASVLVPILYYALNLGVLLIVVHLLAVQGLVNPASLVRARPMVVTSVTVLLSLLGGFALRCALRSFTEIKRTEYSGVPGYLELCEAGAFVLALILYVPFSSATQVGVAIWMVFTGWELGSYFALTMRTYKAAPLCKSP